MLQAQHINFFGLGAEATPQLPPQTVAPTTETVATTIVQEEAPHKPIFAPKARGARITAPVIPEGVPLKCRFDPNLGMWRCSYETWWKQPSVYSVAIMALAAFGFGFLMGGSAQLRQAVKEAKALSPV
jgi:hypothetical protein